MYSQAGAGESIVILSTSHSYISISLTWLREAAAKTESNEYYGLNYIPPPRNSHIEVLSPVPQNVTVFGDKIFDEVIVKMGDIKVGPSPMWLLSLGEEIKTQT